MMKAWTWAAALLLLAPARAAAQPVTPLPLRSGEIAFKIRVAAAPDFTGHVAVDSATFTGTSLAEVRGSAVVRVADMRTGIGLRDHHLRNAMNAKHFPDIRFELLGVIPGESHGDTVAATFLGRLTIHGVSRDDTSPATVILAAGGGKHLVPTADTAAGRAEPPPGDTVSALATFDVDMREFGIKPPTRFLGIVRVQPVVRLTVHLLFGAPAKIT
jgi:polyisoprenoid-binding protein YceI